MSSEAPLFSELVESIEYHLFEGRPTVVCGLKLVNGYVVTGVCTCPEPLSLQEGSQAAMDDAYRRLDEFMEFVIHDVKTGSKLLDKLMNQPSLH